MSLAVLASRALRGIDGVAVRVEVHVGPGLPAFYLVGLPDAGVRESRERVRAAIISSGYEFPAGRITANLAPADLPKESGRFDLPIALGILLASGQIAVGSTGHPPDLSNYVFAGELSLTGALAPVDAPLVIAMAVWRSCPQAVLVMPKGCAGVAAHVKGLNVLQASSLQEVVAHLSGTASLGVAAAAPSVLSASPAVCLSDVRGQASARRALEIAASGGHSLLMSGPPGAGKSMLAHRLPGLLPQLDDAQMLEVAALASLAGQRGMALHRTPPFRSPHHSASMPALVGGGAIVRPGEISLAHRGVLFLDELPEFGRRTLESMREPLETGLVSIARAVGTVTYPAVFQLVAAMNPCPCGWSGHAQMPCHCTPEQILKYRGRLSGPLLDRIDLQIALPAVNPAWMDAPLGESSAVVRERVLLCRQRQMRRQGCMNAMLAVQDLETHCRFVDSARDMLRQAWQRWNWSARVSHRIMRVARTLADMQGLESIGPDQLAEAIQYRQPWGGAPS